MKIDLLTYSSSNTSNVKRLFKKVFNQEIHEINDLNVSSDILILPGVGNFEFVKNELDHKGIVRELLNKNFKKIFGICLGMHLLQKDSEECENGRLDGYKFGNKSVVSIASEINHRKVHTGWNKVIFVDKKLSFLNGYYFFSHSFGILWSGDEDELAYYEINNKRFVAFFCLNKFMGVQFHPELSGEKGRLLIKNFIKP